MLWFDKLDERMMPTDSGMLFLSRMALVMGAGVDWTKILNQEGFVEMCGIFKNYVEKTTVYEIRDQNMLQSTGRVNS